MSLNFDSFDGDDQEWAQGQKFWRLKYTRHDVLWQNKNGTRLNVF